MEWQHLACDYTLLESLLFWHLLLFSGFPATLATPLGTCPLNSDNPSRFKY